MPWSVTTWWMCSLPWAASQTFPPGKEASSSRALLVAQRFCVGEPGEPVDDGVQVDVAALRPADFARLATSA